MKFTKEEIETAKKIYCNWNDKEYTLFCDYADSLLKPKIRRIVIGIEYQPIPDFITEEMAINLTVNDVRESLKSRMNKEFNITVTELSEVFGRQDMLKFARYYHLAPAQADNTIFNEWLSERSKK